MSKTEKDSSTSNKRRVGEHELFHNLMEHISDSVYFKDRDSRFLAGSERMAKHFGAGSNRELVGKTDWDYFTREHAEQAMRDEQEIIRTGEPIINKEEKETWPDGHETWVSTSKIPLRDADDNIIGTFGISRDITDRKRMEWELEEKQRQLQNYVWLLEQDLDRARVIQRSMLPSEPPLHPRLRVAYRMNPLETVGGDFLAFYPLPHDRLGLFLGDLAGHGVSAALFMALVRFITDRLNATHENDPAGYLGALNEALMDQMPSAFITAIYGCFSCRNEGVILRFASAGHPEPILETAQETQFLETSSNAAIGVLENFDCEPLEVEMQKGDRIFFYTDGITETMNPAGEMLGNERLREIIKQQRNKPLTQALDGILAATDGFRGGQEVCDDIMLIGFEVI